MKTATNTLQTARVHIGGLGRIGTSIALALHAAGVGQISCNDPQNFEQEQLEICTFSRRSDLGRPKVHALARFLDGRPGLTFVPIVARNESRTVRPYLEQANVIVSCANNRAARLHLEHAAIMLGKPCVQACAQDARVSLGGLVSVWRPATTFSCFGCLFPNRSKERTSKEILLPTVTGTIAAFAAHIIIEVLRCERGSPEGANVFSIDLYSGKIRPMSLDQRRTCSCCASKRSSRRSGADCDLKPNMGPQDCGGRRC